MGAPEYNEALIAKELVKVISSLDHRLTQLEAEAESMGCHVMDLRDRLGRSLADDLIIAKANALVGLARLTK